MDTRRTIVAFLVAMAVFLLWNVTAPYILPKSWLVRPQAATQPATTEPSASTQPGLVTPGTTTTPSGVAMASAPSGSQPVGRAVAAASSAPILLGSASKDGEFPMQVRVEPRGATIAEADIRGHYETVKKKDPYKVIEPVTIEGGKTLYAFATAKVRFENLNLDVPLDEVTWHLTQPDAETVVGTVDVQNAQGQPIARVIKTYRLPRQPAGSPRFDMDLSIAVQNLSGAPQKIILVQEGPVGFRREDLRAEDRSVIGANWNGQSISAAIHLRDAVAKKGKIELGADRDTSRIAWAAEVNRYFAVIMSPDERKGPQDAPRFAAVEAVDQAEANDPKADAPLTALSFQYVTTPRDIPPGGTETVSFDLYIGPKSKSGFQDVEQYALLDYYTVIRQSFYACAPSALVAVMMKLLGFFHLVVRNWGVSIIVLVLVVRTILHPITKKSQVNMMKMQKHMSVLQPRVEAAKKKYANDKMQLNQEIMKIYQEAGVNPAGNLLSCLPLMLQIPIWGALWAALNSTIEMRHAPFDGWWIKDLTSPDALISFNPVHIPLISSMMGGPITSLNILPILLGISQLLQTKYMPRSAAPSSSQGSVDQMEQQRKMMMWMSGIFVLFLYNGPSGLNLYIMASNFFGILEQWRIRQHIKEEEARMAAAPSPGGDDAGAAAKRASSPSTPAAPRKETWLERKWRELEKQAHDAKKMPSGRDKRSK